MELVTDRFLLYIINIDQCNLFTMCSFFNSSINAIGKNNTMYSKNRTLFFKLTQLASLSQKNLGKLRIRKVNNSRDL